MKYTIFFLLLLSNIFAIDLSNISKLYKMGEFNNICQDKNLNEAIKNKNDEIINIYALSCLQLDKVNRLIKPILSLYKTPKARENAALFTTILLQKKLLYRALVDNIELNGVKLPKTDYILSTIFDKFVKKEYIKKDGVFIFKVDDYTYQMYTKEEKGILKLCLDSYKNGILEKSRRYW